MLGIQKLPCSPLERTRYASEVKFQWQMRSIATPVPRLSDIGDKAPVNDFRIACNDNLGEMREVGRLTQASQVAFSSPKIKKALLVAGIAHV